MQQFFAKGNEISLRETKTKLSKLASTSECGIRSSKSFSAVYILKREHRRHTSDWRNAESIIAPSLKLIRAHDSRRHVAIIRNPSRVTSSKVGVPKSNCARRKLSTVGACDNSLLSRSLYRLRVQWNQLRCCVGAACDDETIVSWLQRWVERHVYARTANNSTLIIQTLWSHLIIFLLSRRDDFMTNCLLLHLWIPQAFLS